MGVLHTGQQIEEQADFEKMFKHGKLFLLNTGLRSPSKLITSLS